MDTIHFTINGKPVVEADVAPTTTLLNYLRDQLGLTGTKEGCAEGDCGACTVVVIDTDADGKARFKGINSCLVLLPMVQGKQVYTVEALRDPASGAYHPVQESLVEQLGSQCGYCTPGIIMSMFEACYRADLDEDWKVDDQMCGNLCRCTGYRPIMDATRKIAGLQPEDRFSEALSEAAPGSMALEYAKGAQRFFTPVGFEELWDVLDANADARFVVGGTDLSLEITKRFQEPACLVSLEGLAPLRRLEADADGSHWHIGSGVTLSELEAMARDAFPSVERMVRFFGARQIKNRATVGGNLCTASPIGDLAPAFISLGAEALLRSRGGTRAVPLEAFFCGYRQTALEPGEILEGLRVPVAPKGARVCAYKVSKRQELDISTVSAGFFVELDDDGEVLQARLAFGGMAATPKRAASAELALVGRRWSAEVVEEAAVCLSQDFTPMTDHRGSAWYRSTVAANLLRGFYEETSRDPAPRLPYRPTGTIHPETQP